MFCRVGMLRLQLGTRPDQTSTGTVRLELARHDTRSGRVCRNPGNRLMIYRAAGFGYLDMERAPERSGRSRRPELVEWQPQHDPHR
jgi:hypothetical protein